MLCQILLWTKVLLPNVCYQCERFPCPSSCLTSIKEDITSSAAKRIDFAAPGREAAQSQLLHRSTSLIAQTHSNLVKLFNRARYFGNPRHTQAIIAYMILTDYFWKFQRKNCIVGMLFTRLTYWHPL